MTVYYHVHDRPAFETLLRPVLGEVARRRSFRPLTGHLNHWYEKAQTYARRYHIPPSEIFLLGISPTTVFQPLLWRTLVGELLVLLADELPEIPGQLTSLVHWLGAKDSDDRMPLEQAPPVCQVLYGSQPLTLGLVTYRFGQAGYNAAADVVRLAHFLDGVSTDSWQEDDLQAFAEFPEAADREEELIYARQTLKIFQELYRSMAQKDQVLVVELHET